MWFTVTVQLLALALLTVNAHPHDDPPPATLPTVETLPPPTQPQRDPWEEELEKCCEESGNIKRADVRRWCNYKGGSRLSVRGISQAGFLDLWQLGGKDKSVAQYLWCTNGKDKDHTADCRLEGIPENCLDYCNMPKPKPLPEHSRFEYYRCTRYAREYRKVVLRSAMKDHGAEIPPELQPPNNPPPHGGGTGTGDESGTGTGPSYDYLDPFRHFPKNQDA